MKNYTVIVGVVAVAIVITFWVVQVRVVQAPSPQACTQEAKLCPDGSAVGRTGPNCEFAECPTSNVTDTTAIGGSVIINGTTIGILGLVEDSRCPVDVQCIQAGTVRVRASINSLNRDFTFTLGQSQVVGDATITLASVIPTQKFAKQTIQPSDYRFTFTVVPKVTTTSNNSGVRGTVSLGPTCPVQRIPPDPQCADKPYATDIAVYRANSTAIVTTGKSNTNGTFEFSLSPGSYTLVLSGATMKLPRCNDTSVTVLPDVYTTTTISCDTGIR